MDLKIPIYQSLFSSHDHIICEHPLPLPDEKELKDMEWDDFVFMAEKLNCKDERTEEYQIGDNGFIYKKIFTDEEKGYSEIDQQDITRDITFFGLRSGEEHDYTLKFSSLFYKGELKEIKLKDFKKEKFSKEEREKIHKEAVKFFESEEMSLSWYHEYLIEPFKSLISFPFYIIFLIFHYIAVALLRVLIWIK